MNVSVVSRPFLLKELLTTLIAIFLIFSSPFPVSAQTGAAPSVSIAVFQVLGIKKEQVGKILETMRTAYKNYSGREALSLSELKARMGDYGVTHLKTCSLALKCFLSKGKKHLHTTYAVLLGLGGFGEKIFIDFIVLDLSQGKQLHKVSRTFTGIRGLEANLPALMRQFFPQLARKQGTLKLTGTPQGAEVYIDGKKVGLLPFSQKVDANKPLKIKVIAPKHLPQTLNIKVKENQVISQTITLATSAPNTSAPKLPVAGRSKPTPRSQKKKSSEKKMWYQEWWIWAAAGGVVLVGAGVAIGIAAASAKPTWPEVQVPF